jgi:biotin carboxylase
MSDVLSGPVLVVGFTVHLQAALAAFLPENSVIFVEEPDVIRKRDVGGELALLPSTKEVMPWEYQLPGAAERFYLEHAGLRPAAVIPGAEYAVPFAARLAERYNLPGAGFGAALILRDKKLLRSVTASGSVRNPLSVDATSKDDVHAFLARHAGPVILKPANRQGSVGTKVISDQSEVDEAWAGCLEQDEGKMVPDREIPVRMLVEQFVTGREYSVEMLVRDGVPLFANVTAKMLFSGPYPVELGHIVPANIPEELRQRLVTCTDQVIQATGFATGIVHCEWIVADEPYLVECAGRVPGDTIDKLIGAAWGFDLLRAYVDLMRGGRPVPPESPDGTAAVWFLHPQPGRVLRVAGVDQALARPGVLFGEVSAKSGTVVRALRTSWDRIGYVAAVAGDERAALRAARSAADMITVVTVPASVAADVAPPPASTREPAMSGR